MTTVEVWVGERDGDVRAGTLYTHRRGRTESASFSYDSTYLARPDAYALDPMLPLATGSYQAPANRAMFGAFRDSAPDRWGRSLVTRREAALARKENRAARQLGEIDFLLGVRDDLRQGALRFAEGGGPFLATEADGVPALTDLPKLLDLAARADADTADLPDLQRLIRVSSSLGGARPKAHVVDGRGRMAIAKFPSASNDTWNVMAWEKVALDLARVAAIRVPDCTLHRLADRSVLVVDRFDRTSERHRVGYASAMTMLEATDGDQRSYLEIAEVIEERSNKVTKDLRELWRRIVFSIFISNTDDHLRNHGFLQDRADSWRLAPAFDLNPDPSRGPKLLSTAIIESDDAADVGLALSVAELFRLDDREAAAMVSEVAGAVSQWRTVAKRVGLDDVEVAAMEPAFTSATAYLSHA